jgi:hypothetical protein
MKKAKAQRRAKLPLDDSRWWSWGRAIEHVRQLRLSRAIADQELATAINERHVGCKMEWLDRRTDLPQRAVTLLEDSFFAVFRIEPGWGKLLSVAHRPNAHLPRDHVLYAWGPDIEKIWPSAEPSEPRAADPLTPPVRRRGGVLKHEWHAICAEIARRCIDPKTGRVAVPKSENKLAEDTLKWLSGQGIDPPAPSEMREAVKHVCAALRTAQK